MTPCLRQLAGRRVAAGAKEAQVARELGVSRQAIYAWLLGPDNVEPRSCRPHRSPTRIPWHWRRQIRKQRCHRWSSRRIDQHRSIPLSTVGRELRRLGLGRLPSVDGPRRRVPDERDRHGRLVHLDLKRLARITRVGHRIHGDSARRTHGPGWAFVHVAIDDHTRLAQFEELP